jgi:hypothetical protein
MAADSVGSNIVIVPTAGFTNITAFDGNIFNADADCGTSLSLRGGHRSELANHIEFTGHKTEPALTRWHIGDDPRPSAAPDPHFRIARGSIPGIWRLVLFTGENSYNIASAMRNDDVVTVTTTDSHGIGLGSFVRVSGVTQGEGGTPLQTPFDGVFKVNGVTDMTFQYDQTGRNESARPGTGTVVSFAANFDGESHLSGEGNGGVVFNRFSGTGGLRLYDGGRSEVAALDSTGKMTRYKGIATVGNGVPAQYAQVHLTNQSASIGTTTAYPVPSTGAGLYRISYYTKTTRAATTTGSVRLTLGWTDADDNTMLTTVPATLGNAVDGVQAGSLVANAKAQRISPMPRPTQALARPVWSTSSYFA